MKSMRRLLGQFLIIAVGGMAGLALVPAFGLAQEASNETRIQDENDVGRSIQDLSAKNSRFRLFGQGDRAVTSLKATGTTAYGRGMEHFVTNTGIVDAADLNMDTQPDVAASTGRVGHCHSRAKPPADDLDRVAVQPQAEVIGRKTAHKILKDLAFQRESSASMSLGRTLGHDRHVEVGGHHADAILGGLGENAGEDRNRGSILDNTLQDRELLEDRISLQFEFHQQPLRGATKYLTNKNIS